MRFLHSRSRGFLTVLTIAAAYILLNANSALAQSSDVLDTIAQARSKMQQRQWAEAASLWERVVKANPVNGQFWEQLGTAYYNAGDYRRSIPAYERQIELGYGRPASAAYNIACDYAVLGDKESAIKWLTRALGMKFPSVSHARTDEDLKSLHGDPRFQQLLGLIDTSRMTRDEGWRTDLRYLASETKRRGWNLFPRIGTEAEFDAQIKRLSDSIPKLTDAQVSIEMLRLMKRVGDGHSSLLGPSTPREEWTKTLPVLFYMFEEGVFIIAADPAHKDLLGSQVIKFGGKPINEVVDTIQSFSSEDNKIWIKQIAPYRLRHLPLLNAAGAIPDPDKVELVLKTMDGTDRTVTVAADTTQPNIWNVKPNPPEWVNLPQTLNQPLPLYLKQPATRYWFEYLPEKRAVYFQFNSVRDDDKEPLSAFCDRLFKFVAANDVDKLIIDMRWNNGGNTGLLPPLIHGLIKSEKINRRGHLFVIIGRRTFSAAQNAATFIDRETDAIFVGEPTGSSPNFVGEEDPFTLPYSKLIANISHLYWESSYPQDQRTWIAPEIYAPPTFEAYRTNKDPSPRSDPELPLAPAPGKLPSV
jgi:tetratricopeptide (TPR) repeat protein